MGGHGSHTVDSTGLHASFLGLHLRRNRVRIQRTLGGSDFFSHLTVNWTLQRVGRCVKDLHAAVIEDIQVSYAHSWRKFLNVENQNPKWNGLLQRICSGLQPCGLHRKTILLYTRVTVTALDLRRWAVSSLGDSVILIHTVGMSWFLWTKQEMNCRGILTFQGQCNSLAKLLMSLPFDGIVNLYSSQWVSSTHITLLNRIALHHFLFLYRVVRPLSHLASSDFFCEYCDCPFWIEARAGSTIFSLKTWIWRVEYDSIFF